MSERPSTSTTERLRRELLEWFDAHRRELPWRGSPTPYQVWVSEVMLQQTRVETVKLYYERWMRRFPDLESLAAAEEGEVLGLWQGLGYYSRARRLLEGARFVFRERGGQLPREPRELLEVPGIGPYSAGAIASIAHGQRAPLVDGNVVRVLTRLLGLGGDPARAPLSAELWRVAERLVPEERPGDFNQALMELGALVCTPKSPSCLGCPWRASCVAFSQGEPTRYPEKPAPRKATEIVVVVLLLEQRGALAFEDLPKDARWWAGLAALPSLEWGSATGGALSSAWRQRASRASLVTEGELPTEERWAGFASALVGTEVSAKVLPPLAHQVTRFKVQLRPIALEIVGKRPTLTGHRWVRPAAFAQLALPAPHRRLLEVWKDARTRSTASGS